MPSIQVYETDKAKIMAMRRQTPEKPRLYESAAMVVHRLLERDDMK